MKRILVALAFAILGSLALTPHAASAAISSPTSVKAESTPGTGTAKISWIAPGGATQYRVRAFIGDVAVKTSGIVSARTSYIFTGLEYDIKYVLKVEASDGTTWSNAVAAPAVTPVAASPSAPSTPVAIVIADYKIKMTWDPPSNDGGSPVTDYLLQVQKDGNDFGEPVKTPSLSYTVETKELESTYTLYVQAVNQAGKTSPKSEQSEGKIPKLTTAAVVTQNPNNNGGNQNSPSNGQPTIDQTKQIVSPSPVIPAFTKVVKPKSVTSSKNLVALSKLSAPKGSKATFSIASSSRKICQLKGTSIKLIKAGTCSVKVTVTTKSGKKNSRTVKLIAR
jgi:hypothetical protein